MISPLYGQLSPLRIPTRVAGRLISNDADVNAYLNAVEAADGQELEAGAINAVESFVLGCKSDGIWSAIKASCILAGARTLSGALVPLVGTAPTNFNFVSADYDRETGLQGNALTKYLNSNRADNAEPQNSKHAAVFVQRPTMGDLGQSFLGAITTDGTLNGTQLYTEATVNGFFRVNSDASHAVAKYNNSIGLIGATRSNSSQLNYRLNGSNSTVFNASAPSQNILIHIFQRNWSTTSPTNARISFYSIGEHLNLAALDTRVSTLMTALAAAIP